MQKSRYTCACTDRHLPGGRFELRFEAGCGMMCVSRLISVVGSRIYISIDMFYLPMLSQMHGMV